MFSSMVSKSFLDTFIMSVHSVFKHFFHPMKRNDGYDYLLNHYLFQVDSYYVSQKDHKLRLRAIGNRVTHNIDIFSVPNDVYLLSNIDPRDLIELGSRLFMAGKNQLFQKNQYKSLQQGFSSFYKLHTKMKLYFQRQLERKKSKTYYPYSLVDRSYLENDVALSLSVKSTGLTLNILLSNLSKDLLLASQVNPKHLINLGYEMAERNISAISWN